LFDPSAHAAVSSFAVPRLTRARDFVSLSPELLDVQIEHDYEALDQMLSSDRLAGKPGERTAPQNQRFRRCIGIHSFAVRFVSLAL
jgi:hypothetical protein